MINTQRMLCANQEMVRDCYAFLQDEPPVVLDWAPWNHTAGGNKVFNMVLYNGGTFYIDDGRPTPGAASAETARNLARCRADVVLQRAERLRGAASRISKPTRPAAGASSAA